MIYELNPALNNPAQKFKIRMHVSNASVPVPFRGAFQGHFSDRVFPGPRWAICHQGCAQGGEFVIEEFNIFYHSSNNNNNNKNKNNKDKTRISYNMRGGRSEKAELTTFRRVYMQKFGPSGHRVDRGLKITGDNNN